MNVPTQEWGPAGCLFDGDVATLNCIPVVIQNIVNFALIFASVVAVFLVIFSGIKFISSAGDKEKIESAKKTLTWAIAGLILIIFSFVIINVISEITGVKQLVGQ